MGGCLSFKEKALKISADNAVKKGVMWRKYFQKVPGKTYLVSSLILKVLHDLTNRGDAQNPPGTPATNRSRIVK
jgi:hypothetical protein